MLKKLEEPLWCRDSKVKLTKVEQENKIAKCFALPKSVKIAKPLGVICNHD